jgi:cytochrome b involved in lipid metabolism
MLNKKYLYSGVILVVLLSGLAITVLLRTMRTGSDTTYVTGSQTEIPIDEVARHNSPNDCWVYIGGQVFNATPIIAQNTSQQSILSSVCGRDGAPIYTVQKYADQTVSRADIVNLREQLSAYQIGLLSP